MSQHKHFTKATKAMLEHDQLPGIDLHIDRSDLAYVAFQARRDALAKQFKDLCGGRCWACGAKHAVFICENRNLRTLRRRCMRCLRQDRREAAIAAEAAALRRANQEAIERFKLDLGAIQAMPTRDRDLLLEPLAGANILGVPIPVASPLWNALAVGLLRKFRESDQSSAAA